jgi:uncharacterized membrane protein YedE/YeeE
MYRLKRVAKILGLCVGLGCITGMLVFGLYGSINDVPQNLWNGIRAFLPGSFGLGSVVAIGYFIYDMVHND